MPGPALGRKKFASPEAVEVPSSAELLLFSDGIEEAVQRDGTRFTAGFAGLLGKVVDPLAGVIARWEAECGDDPRRDDATLLLAVPAMIEWRGECTAESIARIRLKVERWLGFHGADDEDIHLTVLGLDELLTNILKHDPPESANPQVDVMARMDGTVVRFEICHPGQGITDLLSQPRVSNAGHPGGRGLRLIANLFAELEFTRGEQGRCRIVAARSLRVPADG
jgi:anti-sigma regulatory factor (Ser/Thr protein kinase)